MTELHPPTQHRVPVVVDLHAHLFNGYDLPVAEFIQRSVHPTGRGPVDALVGRALALYSRRSPSDLTDSLELIGLMEGSRGEEALVAGVTGAPTAGGKVIEWVAKRLREGRMLTEGRRSRFTMLQDLQGWAGPTEASTDLFVPLGVDLEPGLAGLGRASPNQQFDVIELLSEASLRGALAKVGIPGIVLPMVGFDPRREIDDLRNNLRQVQRRVELGQAVGVKLYPPMGFTPIGNPDPQVDRQLHELYEWCSALQVPITAHCSPANAVAGAGDFAHPCRWHEVLRVHPRLRLNLAHVGGIGGGWAKEAIDLIAEHLHTTSWVSADVSNHDLSDSAAMTTFLKRLTVMARQAADAHGARPSEVLGRLAFGTDFWFLYMHPHPEAFFEGYERRIREAFADPAIPPQTLDALVDAFLGGTALAFLDLAAGRPNHQRVLDRARRLQHDPRRPLAPPPSFMKVMGLPADWTPTHG